MLSLIIGFIDNINTIMGKLFAWLCLIMVVLMFTSVLMRYTLSTSLIWQQELIRYMYGMVFLACAAWTCKLDKHVRVDIFYQRFAPTTRAWVNLIGTVLCIFPTTITVAYVSTDFTLNSWSILESSPEYGGMPAVFIYKSFIWVFAISILLQGISIAGHALTTIRGNTS